MKKIITIVAVLLITGCHKDADIAIQEKIMGTWTWIESTGGIDGRTETPESTGNVIEIEFTANKYRKYVNDVLEDDLFYSVQRGGSIWKTGVVEQIIYENGDKQSFEVNGSNLVLMDECIDCFRSTYSKE